MFSTGSRPFVQRPTKSVIENDNKWTMELKRIRFNQAFQMGTEHNSFSQSRAMMEQTFQLTLTIALTTQPFFVTKNFL